VNVTDTSLFLALSQWLDVETTLLSAASNGLFSGNAAKEKCRYCLYIHTSKLMRGEKGDNGGGGAGDFFFFTTPHPRCLKPQTFRTTTTVILLF